MILAIDLTKSSPIQLPNIALRWFPAHPKLRPWVQCYWSLPLCPVDRVVSEIMYPDGGASLLFYSSKHQPLKILFDGSHALRKFSLPQSTEVIGIRFNPGGASQLLNRNFQDLCASGAMDEIFSEETIDQLQTSIALHSRVEQKIACIESWLINQIIPKHSPKDLMSFFLPAWLNTQKNLDELLPQFGVSRRNLERQFQQAIGLSPQSLKLLQRVKLARQEIAVNPHGNLAQIGQACGFYDQAHFIRQFQQLTGQTPGQYKSKKLAQKYNS